MSDEGGVQKKPAHEVLPEVLADLAYAFRAVGPEYDPAVKAAMFGVYDQAFRFVCRGLRDMNVPEKHRLDFINDLKFVRRVASSQEMKDHLTSLIDRLACETATAKASV